MLLSGIFPGLVPASAAPVPFGITIIIIIVFDKAAGLAIYVQRRRSVPKHKKQSDLRVARPSERVWRSGEF